MQGNFNTQICVHKMSEFNSALMCSCSAYTLVGKVTFCVCYQLDPWQRNQSSVEREVGQQQSILDREREVVEG